MSANDIGRPERIMALVENPQSPSRQGLDPYSMKEIMERLKVPGVSIAAIHDFGIHWAKGYGIADVESRTPAVINTLFQAASISKPVGSMAALRAVEEGRLGLDEDINDILKTWKIPEGVHTVSQKVTPRSLMSHTSGFGDGFGFPGYEPNHPLPTVVQVLKGEAPSNLGPVVQVRPPFESCQYSGGGVTVMQLALEEATGRPYAQLLQDSVLTPIGMSDSVFEQPLSPDRDSRAARAHDDEGKSLAVKWHVYPELAAAGLWTTPSDLAKFTIEVQLSARGRSNRVLSRTVVGEMLSPVGVGDFAAGFQIQKRGQGWYFGHNGANLGFRCALVAHKLKGYGYVVMTNGENGEVVINEISERIERAYGYDSLDKPVLS